MFKRMMIIALLVSGFTALSATEANAWIVRRRIAPVRRVARVALPPYGVRRVVRRPVVYGGGPVYAAPAYAAPVYAAPAPVYYAPRVRVVAPRVHVGVGIGYGW